LFYATQAAATGYFTRQPDVQNFIDHMVTKHHFKSSELQTLFSHVEVRPSVIRSVKAPLEKKPWHTYQMLFVTEWRIQQGAAFWKKYHAALSKAEKIYGVPASIIVATIGVETKYGKNTGGYRVIDALTNLAFNNETSRAKFFRSELEQFLLLTREEHLNPFKVTGSHAGAIGQPQFMPSSYRNYAVNFSGGKHIDLSKNEVDVIGSIANYYNKHGWRTHQPVTAPIVSLSRYNTNAPTLDSLSHYDLAKFGLNTRSSSFKKQNPKILQLEGYIGKEYWVSFHNFDVIKRYNPSDLYAMAVYQLSYQIAELREKTNHAEID
jgi:membrane-bound lytic murein transglycosylase B